MDPHVRRCLRTPSVEHKDSNEEERSPCLRKRNCSPDRSYGGIHRSPVLPSGRTCRKRQRSRSICGRHRRNRSRRDSSGSRRSGHSHCSRSRSGRDRSGPSRCRLSRIEQTQDSFNRGRSHRSRSRSLHRGSGHSRRSNREHSHSESSHSQRNDGTSTSRSHQEWSPRSRQPQRQERGLSQTSRHRGASAKCGVWSLRNLSISVPRAVLSGEGQSAILRCSYDLEDAALYSIRWYRAETEFYRYVPREMPPTMVFPLPGASVDLTQSDHQQVRIVNLNRRLSGDYQCEVSADAPLFHTDIRSAPLTVVDPPFRAPHLSISRGSYARGDILRANCSVDEAYPAPNITWILDDHKIAETVSWRTSDLDFKERGAFSRLEISILEAEHYKMGLTYTSASLSRAYQENYYGYEKQPEKEDKEILRYTLIPPPSGQFSLSCVATIYDIYARKGDSILIREDAPHPASVTGEDSSGTPVSYNLALTSLCAGAVLLHAL